MTTFSLLNSKTSKLALSLIFVATLAACGGGDDGPATTAVVNAPVSVALDQTTAAAGTASLVAAKTMSFPAGIPLLGTSSSTTMVFSSPTAGNTDIPFTITSAGVTSKGNLTFGSCRFTINETPVGTVLTPPVVFTIPTAQCTLRLDTANAAADGISKQRSLTFILGSAISAAAQIPVVVNADGTITVSSVVVARGTVVQITGAAS